MNSMQASDKTPATLSMSEACALLGISSWLGYQLAARREFPVPILRIGARRIRVPTAPLARYLDGR